MTALRQAQDLTPRDLTRTITGYDTEGTLFHGPLHGADYKHGTNTIHLLIGRAQVEVRLTEQLRTTGRNA